MVARLEERKLMVKIIRVTITEFDFEVKDLGLKTAAAGVGNMAYVKGSVLKPHHELPVLWRQNTIASADGLVADDRAGDPQ
jgi:hypothetical protein